MHLDWKKPSFRILLIESGKFDGDCSERLLLELITSIRRLRLVIRRHGVHAQVIHWKVLQGEERSDETVSDFAAQKQRKSTNKGRNALTVRLQEATQSVKKARQKLKRTSTAGVPNCEKVFDD